MIIVRADKRLRAEINVGGVVQGVGFRPFIYRIATNNQLIGYVQNRGDAIVRIVVQGNKHDVERFCEELKKKRPPLARIHNLTTRFTEDTNEFKSFSILKSSKEVELSGSVIPPDVSICAQCLTELHDPTDRRYDYFFITCTDCGPRYTMIRTLPYDRSNTTMHDFPMCRSCSKEYKDPLNRRFHAQTVACSKCGPRVYLTTKNGEPIEHEDPIREAGRLLDMGHIVAIKGYGGFHVATSTTRSEPIARLRQYKHRTQKPFAIMARNIDVIPSFAEVNPKEAKTLVSHIKPIVLLKKNKDYYLSELISPGLHNIGVMLPYTGMHVMLFAGSCEPAFILTSANPPNEPIMTDNFEAMRRLGSIADFFLFYDRVIAQRCDDSVVKLHGEKQSLIRRSRGYAPEPLHLEWSAKRCVLGLGAELNVTTCILLQNKAFISQHIGDVENLETLAFLKKTISHLLHLTNSEAEVVACDLHPKFTTTRLARDLSNQLQTPVISVQHHHAHIASLMGEHSIHEMVGIVCDGFGYGPKGELWGGEVLYCNNRGFQRLGHLQEQPMVGGDLATRYPLRMAAGILHGSVNIEGWLLSNADHFPHGKKEIEVIVTQLEKGQPLKTTSCGRVLDAISAILGVCHKRTYEGEPAMKLESIATKGRCVLNEKPEFRGNVLKTTPLVQEVFTKRNSCSPADLAYSAQSHLAKGLAQLAMEKAEGLGVRFIGFSGGVAYNELITSTLRETIEKAGFQFVVNTLVPPGDGGLSFGQVIAASLDTS